MCTHTPTFVRSLPSTQNTCSTLTASGCVFSFQFCNFFRKDHIENENICHFFAYSSQVQYVLAFCACAEVALLYQLHELLREGQFNRLMAHYALIVNAKCLCISKNVEYGFIVKNWLQIVHSKYCPLLATVSSHLSSSIWFRIFRRSKRTIFVIFNFAFVQKGRTAWIETNGCRREQCEEEWDERENATAPQSFVIKKRGTPFCCAQIYFDWHHQPQHQPTKFREQSVEKI